MMKKGLLDEDEEKSGSSKTITVWKNKKGEIHDNLEAL